VTEELVLAFQHVLGKIRPATLHAAFGHALAHCKFRPTPAEVLEAVKQVRENLPAARPQLEAGPMNEVDKKIVARLIADLAKKIGARQRRHAPMSEADYKLRRAVLEAQKRQILSRKVTA
jgi:hypothetical protein